jgi:hypothetical protein
MSGAFDDVNEGLAQLQPVLRDMRSKDSCSAPIRM